MNINSKYFTAILKTDYIKNYFQLKINFFVPVTNISYYAADTGDKRQSYSGSLLPFHNINQAFFNNDNCGDLEINDLNSTFIEGYIPNAYYESLDKDLIESRIGIHFYLAGKEIEEYIYIPRGYSNRLLRSYKLCEYL